MPTLGQVLRSPGLDLRMLVDAGGDPTVRWVAVSELSACCAPTHPGPP